MRPAYISTPPVVIVPRLSREQLLAIELQRTEAAKQWIAGMLAVLENARIERNAEAEHKASLAAQRTTRRLEKSLAKWNARRKEGKR